jgi:hypothetical protein
MKRNKNNKKKYNDYFKILFLRRIKYTLYNQADISLLPDTSQNHARLSDQLFTIRRSVNMRVLTCRCPGNSQFGDQSLQTLRDNGSLLSPPLPFPTKIRAGFIKDFRELDKYPWSGHGSAILGRCKNPKSLWSRKINMLLGPVTFKHPIGRCPISPSGIWRWVHFRQHRRYKTANLILSFLGMHLSCSRKFFQNFFYSFLSGSQNICNYSATICSFCRLNILKIVS